MAIEVVKRNLAWVFKGTAHGFTRILPKCFTVGFR